MKRITLTENIIMGIHANKVVMYERKFVRSPSYRRIFKIHKKDDINPVTNEIYGKDEMREILIPLRERPKPSKYKPHQGKKERARRLRQLDAA